MTEEIKIYDLGLFENISPLYLKNRIKTISINGKYIGFPEEVVGKLRFVEIKSKEGIVAFRFNDDFGFKVSSIIKSKRSVLSIPKALRGIGVKRGIFSYWKQDDFFLIDTNQFTKKETSPWPQKTRWNKKMN